MNLNKSCFPAWAAVLLLLCSTPFVTSGIAPEKKTRILLVAQHDPTYRLPSDVAYSVIDALDPERTGLPAEINAIWITQHQSDSAVRAALEQLARELQDGRCDLIISRHPLTHPILEFLKARKLDIPVVFYDAPEQEQGLQQEYPNSTGLIRYRDAAETALTAAALFPSCRNIVITSGYDNMRDREERIRRQLAGLPRGYRLLFLYDDEITPDEYVERISGLPAGDVILISTTPWRDKRTGKTVQVDELAARLEAHNPNRKIRNFSLVDYGLNSGVLGGYLISVDEWGRQIADLVTRTIRAGSARHIPVARTCSRLVMNYPLLLKTGARLAALPPDTVFLQKPNTVWDTHRNYVLLASGVILLLLILVALLTVLLHLLRQAREKDRVNAAIFRSLPLQITVLDRNLNLLVRHRDVNQPPVPYRQATTLLDSLSRQTLEQITPQVEQVFRTGRSVSFDYDSDGEWRRMVIYRLPVSIMGRECVLCISLNIDRERKAEEQTHTANRLLQAILDHIPAIVQGKDPDDDYRYVFWNRTSERVSGLPEKTVLGKRDCDIPGMAEIADRLREEDLAVPPDGQLVERTDTYPYPDGTVGYFHAVRRNVRIDEHHSLLLTMANNITEQHILEQEKERLLRRQSDFLKQEQLWNSCLTKLAANEDYAETMNAILEQFAGFFGAGLACLYEYAQEDSQVNITHLWSEPELQTGTEGIRRLQAWRESPFAHRLMQKEVVCLRREQDFVPVNPEVVANFRHLDFVGFYAAGLRQNGRLTGFLLLGFRSEEKFTGTDAALVKACADLLELAITRRNQDMLVRQKERMQSILLDNMNIPVLLFDTAGRMLSMNNEVVKALGLSAEEVLKRPCYQVFCRHDTYPRHCPVQQALRTGEKAFHSFSLNGHDYEVTAIPVLDEAGKVVNVLECAVDVTRQKELQRRTAEALELTRQAYQTKSNFLAMMSHEIRTPLNSIIGFSELLQATSPDSEELHDYAANINTAGQTLLQLINDVLEISRFEADLVEIPLEWVDFNRLLAEIGSIFKHMARKKGLDFRIEAPAELPEIYLNDARLRQILLNLVGNAVKFTEKGGISVSADFRATDSGHGRLEITVRDTGIGIDPGLHSRIFDPFVQADEGAVRGNRTTNGTGLGLSIVKRLLDKMGGSVTLESIPGTGSTFRILFEQLSVRERHTDTGSPQAFSAAEFNDPEPAWVVDDVPMNCRVLAAMLEKLNIRAEALSDPKTALERIRGGEHPKLIFSDMWMPDLNGAELAAAIRRLPAGGTIRIIAVTADTDSRHNFDMSVFDMILTKPVNREKLADALRRLREASPDGP